MAAASGFSSFGADVIRCPKCNRSIAQTYLIWGRPDDEAAYCACGFAWVRPRFSRLDED
jgi:hypothetical protein